MNQAASQFLTPREFRGLEKLGEAFLPGDGDLPSFRALGCAEHVDAILDATPPADRADLKRLLRLVAFAPQWTVVRLVRWLERWADVPFPPGGLLRLLRLGTKGICVTLYYSGRAGRGFRGKTPLEILGYDVSVFTDDLSPADTSDRRS